MDEADERAINEPLNVKVNEAVPMDRLTRLANKMLELLKQEADTDNVQAMILLSDEHNGGGAISGYETNEEALADMIIHFKALAEATGVPVRIGEYPPDGSVNLYGEPGEDQVEILRVVEPPFPDPGTPDRRY